MELKLLEITNSKPLGPINVSDSIKAFCQPFAKRTSQILFVKRKATPINLFIHLGGVSHGDPHDDIQEDLK